MVPTHDLPTKSHSTCSDGSLLSMGSSEMDEDSFGPHSRYSSKLSLHEKKSNPDSDFEFGPSSTVEPLNHSAAHHRVAVRPKRTHGAPRRKRGQQLTSALPVTPEVNEESSIRSMSPDSNSRKETITELYSMSTTRTFTDTQLKCSSLPPGLTAPGAETTKLSRSKSNAGSKSQDHFSPLHEDTEKEEKLSLLERIFPRKSGRKKKAKEEKQASMKQESKLDKEEVVLRHEDGGKHEESRREERVFSITSSSSGVSKSYRESCVSNKHESKPIPAPRSGPASRQRVMPIDIPETPEEVRRNSGSVQLKSSPKSLAGTSPLQAELESMFKQRQQRVLSLNDDEPDNSFKSLTDFGSEAVKPSRPIIKSHSFKSTKQPFDAEIRGIVVSSAKAEFDLGKRKDDNRISFTKAASLDSIKNLEEQTQQSELKLELKPTSITIYGPSHRAVVNVTNNSEEFTSKSTSSCSESAIVETDGSKTVSVKENQISVTKIHLKREATQVTQSTVTVPKSAVPEFLNKQLNKVEARPSSNIIFSMKSPRVIEEQNRPKTLFNFDTEHEVTSKPPAPRKFSKENLEIIEKEESDQSPKTPPVVASVNSQLRFKKTRVKTVYVNRQLLQPLLIRQVREKALFKGKSASLDSLRSDANESDQSSMDSLDKLDDTPKVKTGSPISETVVLRRKSVSAKKNDEEPELMKVFARRSLKLKDSDVDSIQETLTDNKARDSDKENQVESPQDERKKVYTKPKEPHGEAELPLRRKSPAKQERVETKSPVKEPLTETKDPVEPVESPVALRRTINNNIFIGQRAVSLNPPKTTTSNIPVKKQSSFTEKRVADHWITQFKNEDSELKEKMQDNIISSDYITEPKNFNQRKAEWEKRAQQAQKRTTP
ncbi:hypothetical protein NQ317_002871 [Molorchus minor]|uniref:DUF4592 domain-containing protein n=1 Tax=Molorchus minor TaxID=1323400 RepID=A0ABQ9J279_9CUCU|nr:hypothetical protein NQ317_002871 [Molorchus minor]